MAEEVPQVRNFGYMNAEYRDMLGVYFACNLVGCAAAAEYRQRFLNCRYPDAAAFQQVWDRMGETGYVGVRNPDGGRHRRARNENDEAILDCFAEDPTTSLQRTARFLSTSYSTCQRVMKDDGQHTYKYRRIHEILEGDREYQLIFSHLIIYEHESDAGFLNRILWTDEVTYVRTGMANPHNEHYWADKNPHLTRKDRFQNRFSKNVWAEIIGDHLIGPFELPARLDEPNYLEFLQNDFPRLLEESLTEEQRQNLIFMHDGAPAHFAIDVRTQLDQVYPNRRIGRGGPARSPDFNPLDYFYWRYAKEKVYHNGAPANVQQLWHRIEKHAIGVERGEIQRATRDILRRVRACVEEEGGPFKHCRRAPREPEEP